MASLAELVRLAERIAAELPEVTRNEWMRWSEVACRRGLAVATQLAGRLATDITVRPAVQRANQLIAQAVRAHRAELERLSDDERRTLLGFVACTCGCALEGRRPPVVRVMSPAELVREYG